jgi:hypothetical protein
VQGGVDFADVVEVAGFDDAAGGDQGHVARGEVAVLGDVLDAGASFGDDRQELGK